MKVPKYGLHISLVFFICAAAFLGVGHLQLNEEHHGSRYPSSELISDPFNTRQAAQNIITKMETVPVASQEVLERKIDNLSVIMRVPLEELESIERYGLLNQHETLRSKGGYNPTLRLRGEQILLGTSQDLEDAPRSLLPKSGYLYFESDDLNVFGRAPDRYGEIIITLKPSVHQRTTYTIGDSSNHAHRGGGQAHPLRDLDQLKKGISQVSPNKYVDYFEALIWGDLNINDIENIFIPEDFSKKNRTKVEQFARRRGLGFGTYQYDIPEYRGDLLEAHLYNMDTHTRNPKLFPIKKYVDTADTKRSTAEVFTVIFESDPAARTPFARPTKDFLLERLQREIKLSEKFVIYQHMIYLDELKAEEIYLELEQQVKKMRMDMFDKEAMLNQLRHTRPLNIKSCNDLVKSLL